MSAVFINCTGETFTPTRSGAISTWNWEVCRAAQRRGVEPWVITRTTDAEPHPWQRTILLDYPWIPRIRGTGLGRMFEIQRKLGGWGHVRQGAYARKVVRAIREAGLGQMPFVLHNDPEMAVHLRRCFPERPASVRVCRSLASCTSVAESGRSSMTALISLNNSVTDSFVLSVCTGAYMNQRR